MVYQYLVTLFTYAASAPKIHATAAARDTRATPESMKLNFIFVYSDSHFIIIEEYLADDTGNTYTPIWKRMPDITFR